MAVMRGHSDTVGMLLDRGADPEAKDRVRPARACAAQRSARERHGLAVDRGGDRGGGMGCWFAAGWLARGCWRQRQPLRGLWLLRGTWPRSVASRR